MPSQPDNPCGGVDIESAGSTPSAGNIIGGTHAGDGNVISGNGRETCGSSPTGAGVDIGGSNANLVEGNLIGTDVTGTTITGTDGRPLGNGSDGVDMYDYSTPSDTQNNIIGGTTTRAGNIISGNGANGVELDAVGAGNNVQGNTIGLGKNGSTLGNTTNGVAVYLGAVGPIVGGATSGPNVCDEACNVIAGNGGSGVLVCDSSTTCGSSGKPANHVAVEGNSIHDNIQSPPSGFSIGQAGEIYLQGEDPASCTNANTAGDPNDDLPCPAAPVLPSLEYNSTTGAAAVLTCAGCTVDFYTWKTTSSTAGGSAGAADENHGGSVRWVGQATPAGGATPCTPSTTGSCSDNTPEASTLPTGLSGVTATATVTYTPSGGSAVTDTSEFGANQGAGSPTLARVARFSARRRGLLVTFSWRMATQSGVVGFNLYAGKQRLNAGLIAVHRRLDYRYQVRSGLAGPFTLHIVLRDGGQVIIPAP